MGMKKQKRLIDKLFSKRSLRQMFIEIGLFLLVFILFLLLSGAFNL